MDCPTSPSKIVGENTANSNKNGCLMCRLQTAVIKSTVKVDELLQLLTELAHLKQLNLVLLCDGRVELKLAVQQL